MTLIALFLAGAVAPWVVRGLGRWAFLVLALVPAAITVLALTQAGAMRRGEVHTEVVEWIPPLQMEIALAMGTLQWVMALMVVGIGALVLSYCTWYFEGETDGLGQFAGVFLAFIGAMLGLLLADDLLLLFVFWELTTIFSYLLIGFNPTKVASRQAAMQALLVTTFGGLAMLIGMLMLGHTSGTLRISEILASPPPPSGYVTGAVMLLLIGAISKSALVPLHFWLPGAMAAPTPVSAYLHAASMVKAGVYLVALLAPVFAVTPGWHAVLLPLGILTMLLGGWRALRQYDIKLLLAYGTVSQLGFLTAVMAIGTRSAAFAGLAMLVAHALFKATLFLVVGIIDRTTGTRDIRELSGLWRSRPALAVVALLGGASMAGVPPLYGFIAKESVLEALVDITESGGLGVGVDPWVGWILLIGVGLGSILTVAYTARFLWGAFADKRGVTPTPAKPVGIGYMSSPTLLAALCLAFGGLGGLLTTVLGPYRDRYLVGGYDTTLSLWHGFGIPLLVSVSVIVLGLWLFAHRGVVGSIQSAVSPPFTAERVYRQTRILVDRTAVEITGMTQRGSVAAYIGVILVVVMIVPGWAVVRALRDGPIKVVLWDSPAQLATGVVVVVAAFGTAMSRGRMRAVLLAGVTGYGTAMLFLLQGGPDIAITQVLVETVAVVIFALVLRRLPQVFTQRPPSIRRYIRILIAVAFGFSVTAFMVAASSARIHDPISTGFPEKAVSFGGGYNIVNVTLVDIRAWDTFGEIAVLVAAATGVASLIFIESRLSGIRRVFDIPYPKAVEKQAPRAGRRVWLPAPRTLEAENRSIAFEVVTRLIFHTIIVFSIYLLFAGHNDPGGGFAAGMVTGLALVIRYLAGGQYELNEAAPVDAGILMGTGLFVAAMSAVAPLAFGGDVLQTAIVDLALGPFGELHLVSSLGFDIGVYLIVVAFILDLLRTFGSRIDRQIRREQRDEAEAAEAEVGS